MTLPAPAHVYQLDGSAWGGQACMGAAGVMALDAYTHGAIRVGFNELRAQQDDKVGGIGLDDVATAWKRGWGQSFTQGYGSSWDVIAGRLAKGDGVVVTINYAAMRSWRAPGSKFTGAHALYLQRFVPMGQTRGIVTNDPLRRSETVIPESVIRTAWTGGAGWGKGTYAGAWGKGSDPGAGATPPGAGTMVGAYYRNGVPLVQYPAGSHAWSVDAIMSTLHAAEYFGSPLDPAAGIAEDLARGIMSQSAGQPWTAQLIALWSAKFFAAGNAAAVSLDPTAGALPAIAGALADLPNTLARSGLVLGIVVLALIGVVLTFREPLTLALPSPVKRIARA